MLHFMLIEGYVEINEEEPKGFNCLVQKGGKSVFLRSKFLHKCTHRNSSKTMKLNNWTIRYTETSKDSG